MSDNFTLEDAFTLDAGLGQRLKVRVAFENGKPSSVSFSDPDRDAMVSVELDIWERVLKAVERCVDMNRADGK